MALKSRKVAWPGSFQYAMGLVGMAQRCSSHVSRVEGVAFGEPLIKNGVQHEIARCRCDIEQARLLTFMRRMSWIRGYDSSTALISMVKIVAQNGATGG